MYSYKPKYVVSLLYALAFLALGLLVFLPAFLSLFLSMLALILVLLFRHAVHRSPGTNSLTCTPALSAARPICQLASRYAYPLPLVKVNPFLVASRGVSRTLLGLPVPSPTCRSVTMTASAEGFVGDVMGTASMFSRLRLAAFGGYGRVWSFSRATPMYCLFGCFLGSR